MYALISAVWRRSNINRQRDIIIKCLLLEAMSSRQWRLQPPDAIVKWHGM